MAMVIDSFTSDKKKIKILSGEMIKYYVPWLGILYVNGRPKIDRGIGSEGSALPNRSEIIIAINAFKRSNAVCLFRATQSVSTNLLLPFIFKFWESEIFLVI